MTAVLKIRDRIYFDGKFVTNGHVAFKRGIAEVDNIVFQSLVDEGRPFAFENGTLKVGEGLGEIFRKDLINIPRKMKVEKDSFSAMLSSKAIRLTGGKYAIGIEEKSNKGGGCRCVYISEDYEIFLNGINCSSYRAHELSKTVYAVSNGKAIVVIKGMQIGGEV